MWLMNKTYISLLLLQFYRRLKLKYILPFTENKPTIKCYDLQFAYETNKYLDGNNVLSWCNFVKHRLNYFLNDIQDDLFFEPIFRVELMMLTPLQWANLKMLGDDSISSVVMPNRDIQCKDEKLCEMAKETWLKGNIVASFTQFSSLYDKGDKLFQTNLIKILQDLIRFSVEKSGMAVVANIVEHVKKFSYEKNELSVLMTLWYALFNSSLFDDNCLADTLLEDKNFKLYLEQFIPCFGANFLKHNEVGSYQRLIETSLTYNLDNAAGILLRLLFNYYCKFIIILFNHVLFFVLV